MQKKVVCKQNYWEKKSQLLKYSNYRYLSRVYLISLLINHVQDWRPTVFLTVSNSKQPSPHCSPLLSFIISLPSQHSPRLERRGTPCQLLWPACVSSSRPSKLEHQRSAGGSGCGGERHPVHHRLRALLRGGWRGAQLQGHRSKGKRLELHWSRLKLSLIEAVLDFPTVLLNATCRIYIEISRYLQVYYF